VSYPVIPDDFPVLKRDGLTLRQLDESDLPAWYSRLTDVEAASLAGAMAPRSRPHVQCA